MGRNATGGHWNNRLADMSLPPEDRTRRKTTRTSPAPVPAQMQHGTGAVGRRRRRDGERKLDQERAARTV